MSIVFPCRKRDFLAPSKALQELKEKLGPVYYDAKLIECPHNAIELGKLLQKWEELDKQKFKKLSETTRDQRILQNSLSSRHLKEPSAVSLLSRGSSTKSFVEITNRNTPPPGFRFHANGDPKLEGLDLLNDLAGDSNTSVLSRSPTRESHTSTVTEGVIRHGRSDDVIDRKDSKQTTKSKDHDYEEIDYSKEIEELEELILQLEAHITNKSEKAPSGSEEEPVKHNYLRARAHSDDFLEACVNRPSANYAYDPEQKQHKRDKKPVNPMFGLGFSTAVKKSSKCLACQFKLKHVGNEFSNPKKSEVMKERWNIAPSGCFLPSPSIRASSTPSLSGSRRFSKPALNRDKSTPNFPDDVSRETSKTSTRRLADTSRSLLSSRASTKDMARSADTDNTIVSSRTSSKEQLRSTNNSVISIRVSSKDLLRSTDTNLSLVSSRVSSKDLGPRMSSTYGSPLRRFLSPQQRESRMQILRQQAEQESRDCQGKVDAFLGQLDKHKSLTRTKHP